MKSEMLSKSQPEATGIARVGRKVIELGRAHYRKVEVGTAALIATVALAGEATGISAAAKKPGHVKQIALGMLYNGKLLDPSKETIVLNPQAPTSETLVASNNTGTTIPNVTLEEIGPGSQKHKWLIKNFRPGTKHERHENFTLPADATSSADTETGAKANFKIEALKKGHQIGLKRETAVYNLPPSDYQSLPGTTYSEPPVPGVDGLFVTGPRTVALNTDYTYQLTVVTDKSYKDAALFIGVPESQYSRLQHFNITAGQPFTESFTTSYDSTYQLTTAGINTYLASSSPATGSYLIYTQQFPMTQATPSTGNS
jgi:hypothetical protein